MIEKRTDMGKCHKFTSISPKTTIDIHIHRSTEGLQHLEPIPSSELWM